MSFDDRGSDGETKKRKRPRPSPQTRDAALLIERAAPISVRQENPKKGKSAERYELYKRATTAREYVALGGTKADLKYDIQRGWDGAHPVTPPAAPAAEAGGSPGSSASSTRRRGRRTPWPTWRRRRSGRRQRRCLCPRPATRTRRTNFFALGAKNYLTPRPKKNNVAPTRRQPADRRNTRSASGRAITRIDT